MVVHLRSRRCAFSDMLYLRNYAVLNVKDQLASDSQGLGPGTDVWFWRLRDAFVVAARQNFFAGELNLTSRMHHQNSA